MVMFVKLKAKINWLYSKQFTKKIRICLLEQGVFSDVKRRNLLQKSKRYKRMV